MARSRAVLASLVVLAALALPTLPMAPAAAAGASRARVIVDIGGQTVVRDITFDGTITGIQALQLAGADPVVYSFNGQGGAVCRLYGVGRDAGPGCLGGADGDPNYWAYFRAPAGSTSFTYSRAGAGSVTVHDGDVEGWRWGTGAAPAWSAAPAPTTTTTAPAPAGGGPTAGGGTASPGGTGGSGAAAATTGGGASSPPAFDPQAVQALVDAAKGAATTSTTDPAGETQVAGAQKVRPASRRAVGALAGDQGGGNGSATSLLLLGGVLGAIAAGGVYLRRSRRGPVR
jgi:hypothetical protein